MDATIARGRKRTVPGWEQCASISCCDVVGGLLGLVVVMKRKVTAPVRSPCSRLGATSDKAKNPQSRRTVHEFLFPPFSDAEDHLTVIFSRKDTSCI